MRILVLMAAVSVASACATAYAPDSFWNDGGFTETEVQPGIYMVRFKGNEYTDTERTADLAMLRAAEICLDRAMAFMYLGSVETTVVPSGYVPGSTRTTTDTSAFGDGVPTASVTRTTVTPPTTLYSPQTGLTVRCAAEKGESAWDAAFLAQAMRAKYQIK